MNRLLIISEPDEADRGMREWIDDLVRQSLSEMEGGAVIFSMNGTPPEWTRAAKARHVKTVSLCNDGYRYDNLVKTKQWHPTPEPETNENDLRTFLTVRNSTILSYAMKAREAGWATRLLSISASWKTSHEVAHMAIHAELSGIRVTQHVYTPPAAARPDVVWIDLETGGMSSKDNPILQIGAVHADSSSRKVLRTFDTKLYPEKGLYMNSDSLRICGYEHHLWVGAPQAKDGLQQFLDWLPQTQFIHAGYNSSFDRRFIVDACARLQLPVPRWKEDKIDPQFTAKTLLKARGLTRTYKLDEVCAYYGISNEITHRALEDAERARLVYLAMLEKEPESSILKPKNALVSGG